MQMAVSTGIRRSPYRDTLIVDLRYVCNVEVKGENLNEWSGRADLNCRPLAPQVRMTLKSRVFCPKTATSQSSEL